MSDRITEIKERLAKRGSPGPWKHTDDHYVEMDTPQRLERDLAKVRKPADAEFIAHTPADIEFLLKTNEAIQSVLDATKRLLVAQQKRITELETSKNNFKRALQTYQNCDDDMCGTICDGCTFKLFREVQS